jgi:hypothetical protein
VELVFHPLFAGEDHAATEVLMAEAAANAAASPPAAAEAAVPPGATPDLLSFYTVEVPPGADPESLAQSLGQREDVEVAYVESGPTPPPAPQPADDPRAVTQGYLDAAPQGVDARHSWTLPGGDGAGVAFIDIEQGWTLGHEDLVAAGITLLSGLNMAYFGHGTAVLGEIRATDNQVGCIGIAPGLQQISVVSQWRGAQGYSTALAIASAAAHLSFGDVMLLEAQVPVPPSMAYGPVEVEPAVFAAIRAATQKGIIVVEAGGNGAVDLDAVTVFGRQILNRNSPDFQDSGAIIVGAATSAVPHDRMGFSCYGSRIDCYAWGESIVTTGDGWEGNLTNSYTIGFGGTSGASPIVTGAAILLQGLAIARLGRRLGPMEIRTLLSNRELGTLSRNPAADRIGVMPDLRLCTAALLGS